MENGSCLRPKKDAYMGEEYRAPSSHNPVHLDFQCRRPMITVHHLNNSRSQRVLWLLEELELPYEIHKYERDPVTMLAPPELTRVHPLGKSPVVTDADLTVAESGAIVEYLVERYGQGRLIPAAGTSDRLRLP